MTRPQNRTDALTHLLRAKIRRGAFPVGSKLPSEQALGAEFQVSRTVVREAVARLKSDGLIQTRKGAAATVRAAKPRQPHALSAPNSIEALLGFLEVRCAIEAEMAALAAERRSPADCAQIAAALRAIDEATASGQDGVRQDLAFHLAIGHATANAYWSQFIHLFAGPMRSAIGVTRANEARRVDFAAAVAEEHRAIFASIRDRAPDAARAAVQRHLRNAALRITQADPRFWEQEGGGLAEDWAKSGLAGAPS